MNKFIEKQFELYDLDGDKQENLFVLFSNSYIKATGASWDKDTFFRKTSNWIFFGDDDITGGIAVRPQASGLVKMNAMFGSPRAIKKGLDEMISVYHDKGIWTVATKNIVEALNRNYGFKSPPPFLVKMLIPHLASAMGMNVMGVSPDGGIEIDTVSGKMTKYFSANKNYYGWLKSSEIMGKVVSQIPKAMKGLLTKFLKLF